MTAPAESLLSLIADLYAQVQTLSHEVAELRQANAELAGARIGDALKPKPTAPKEPTNDRAH